MIVMVCRNNLKLSKKCLETLLAQTVQSAVLVVDNASTDGTTRYMASQQALGQPIYRMTYSTVESVSRCWNLALDWAWLRGLTEVMVVNNDTELLPETYELLLRYRPWYGVVTGISVNREPKLPETFPPSPHPDYSCFMIAREAHRKVRFDEKYEGAYFEDGDHHIRLHRAGIEAISIPVEFRHHRSSTLRGAGPEEQSRINLHYELNQQRFHRQYGCLPGTKAYDRLFDQGQQARQHPEREPR